MDQANSGELFLGIVGASLDHPLTSSTGASSAVSTVTTVDSFISILESSLWLELIWYANQSMAALVCCSAIYDPHALLSAPQHLCGTPEPSITAASTASTAASAAVNAAISTPPTAQSQQLQQPPPPVIATSLLSAAAEDDSIAGGLSITSFSLGATPLPPPSSTPALSVALNPQPAPGYIFHWLTGLLLCRDAKLILSPWLWGSSVVNFGVTSTALRGPRAKTGLPSVRMEDNLRSIVIAAAGGRRLDVVSRPIAQLPPRSTSFSIIHLRISYSLDH